MPAATQGMIDPDGPWRPSTSQRNVNLSAQYYQSHPAIERVSPCWSTQSVNGHWLEHDTVGSSRQAHC